MKKGTLKCKIKGNKMLEKAEGWSFFKCEMVVSSGKMLIEKMERLKGNKGNSIWKVVKTPPNSFTLYISEGNRMNEMESKKQLQTNYQMSPWKYNKT